MNPPGHAGVTFPGTFILVPEVTVSIDLYKSDRHILAENVL